MDWDKLKNISIEGLELLGKGTIGRVYALDGDRVLKVFAEGYNEEKILEEYNNTKNAYEHGVPCPRVYEMARAGSCLAIIMERVEAKTMMEPFREAAGIKDFDRIDFLLDEFAGNAKKIHGIRIEKGMLPDIKEHYLRIIDEVLTEKLSDKRIGLMRKLIGSVKEGDTFIHGDLNFSNVVYEKAAKELRLIDVGAASVGDPIFDLNILPALYFLGRINPLVYELFNADPDTLYYTCEGVLKRYYSELPGKEYDEMRSLYYRSGAVRLLIKLHEDNMLRDMPPAWAEKLSEFMDMADSLPL